MFRWEARGVTGVVRGTVFMGGELVATAAQTKESFEEACAVLGIEPEASLEEIKRVFAVRVQFVHPDKGGDPERFKPLQEAYEHILRVKDRSVKEERNQGNRR